MTAKPKFSTAPKPAALTAEQAAFIDRGRGKDKTTQVAADEPTHRTSVDVPLKLHKRYKAACALAGIKMAPDIIAFIEKRTAELEQQNME
jgi:hypothetical protein